MITKETLDLDSVEENILGEVCFHWESEVGFTHLNVDVCMRARCAQIPL